MVERRWQQGTGSPPHVQTDMTARDSNHKILDLLSPEVPQSVLRLAYAANPQLSFDPHSNTVILLSVLRSPPGRWTPESRTRSSTTSVLVPGSVLRPVFRKVLNPQVYLNPQVRVCTCGPGCRFQKTPCSERRGKCFGGFCTVYLYHMYLDMWIRVPTVGWRYGIYANRLRMIFREIRENIHNTETGRPHPSVFCTNIHSYVYRKVYLGSKKCFWVVIATPESTPPYSSVPQGSHKSLRIQKRKPFGNL